MMGDVVPIERGRFFRLRRKCARALKDQPGLAAIIAQELHAVDPEPRLAGAFIGEVWAAVRARPGASPDPARCRAAYAVLRAEPDRVYEWLIYTLGGDYERDERSPMLDRLLIIPVSEALEGAVLHADHETLRAKVHRLAACYDLCAALLEGCHLKMTAVT